MLRLTHLAVLSTEARVALFLNQSVCVMWADVAAAAHPEELRKGDCAYLCVDHLSMGVGGTWLTLSVLSKSYALSSHHGLFVRGTHAGDDSWSGLTVLPQYWVRPASHYTFHLHILPGVSLPRTSQ